MTEVGSVELKVKLTGLESETAKLKSDLGGIQDASIKVSADITPAKAALRELADGLKGGLGLQNIATGVGQGIGQSIANGIGNAVGAVKGAIADGVSVLKDFRQETTTFAAVSGATKEELKGLADEAKRVGAETSKTPVEAAQAAVQLSKLGFSAKEAKTELSGVVSLAEASGLKDLGKAAEIGGAAYNVFGVSVQKTADVVAATSNATAADAQDLLQAISEAGGVAKANNQSFETLASTFGLLRSAGSTAGVAATSVKTLISRLSAPSTKEAQEGIKRIGVPIRDVDGNMRNLIELIPEFRTAFENIAPDEKAQLVKTIFGDEGAPGFLALLSTSQDKIDSTYKTITNSAGSAAETSKALISGLPGALDLLGGSIDTFKLNLGEAFAPAIESGAVFINEVLGELLKDPDIFGAINQGAEEFAAYLKENPQLVKQTADEIKKVTQAINSTITGAIEFGKAITPAATAIADLTGADIGELAGNINGVVANIRDISDAIAPAKETISDLIGLADGAGDAFKAAFNNPVGNEIVGTFQRISDLVTGLNKSVLQYFTAPLQLTAKVANELTGYVKGTIDNLGKLVGLASPILEKVGIRIPKAQAATAPKGIDISGSQGITGDPSEKIELETPGLKDKKIIARKPSEEDLKAAEKLKKEREKRAKEEREKQQKIAESIATTRIKAVEAQIAAEENRSKLAIAGLEREKTKAIEIAGARLNLQKELLNSQQELLQARAGEGIGQAQIGVDFASQARSLAATRDQAIKDKDRNTQGAAVSGLRNLGFNANASELQIFDELQKRESALAKQKEASQLLELEGKRKLLELSSKEQELAAKSAEFEAKKANLLAKQAEIKASQQLDLADAKLGLDIQKAETLQGAEKEQAIKQARLERDRSVAIAKSDLELAQNSKALAKEQLQLAGERQSAQKEINKNSLELLNIQERQLKQQNAAQDVLKKNNAELERAKLLKKQDAALSDPQKLLGGNVGGLAAQSGIGKGTADDPIQNSLITGNDFAGQAVKANFGKIPQRQQVNQDVLKEFTKQSDRLLFGQIFGGDQLEQLQKAEQLIKGLDDPLAASGSFKEVQQQIDKNPFIAQLLKQSGRDDLLQKLQGGPTDQLTKSFRDGNQPVVEELKALRNSISRPNLTVSTADPIADSGKILQDLSQQQVAGAGL